MAKTEPSTSAMELARDLRLGNQPVLGMWQLPHVARAIDVAVAAERMRCLMLVEQMGYAELLEKIAKGEAL